MIRILSEIVVALSTSAAMSLMVKATAVVTVGLVCAWVARRGRAAARHALLASAFGILLVLPIVPLIAPPVTIRVPALASNSVILPLLDYNPLPLPSRTSAAHLDAAPTESGWSLRSLAAPLSTILFYGWLIGIALFVVPVIRGLLQTRSLRRFGLPWRHGQVVAERLVPRARRGVEVLLNESLPGPMTCGVLRPVVILPADAESWDKKDLERALVHELEHVRRYDWLVHCLARVACAAYWFHPLVWAAWRRLTLEAERSCDDAVLGNSEATAYADQLLGLARRRFAVRRSHALAMADRSDLAARIGALLDRKQPRGPVGASQVAACAVAVAIVLSMSPLRMTVQAQTAPPTLRFEVASVKLAPPPDGKTPMRLGSSGIPGPNNSDPGRFSARLNLLSLVLIAYDIPPYRLSEQSDLYLERLDIEARMPPDTTREQFNVMLQNLLADRLGLKVHWATQQTDAYALVVAKGGPKFKAAAPDSPAASDDSSRNGTPDRIGANGFPVPPTGNAPWVGATPDGKMVIRGHNETMEEFARAIASRTLGAPLTDATGLTGKYDFTIFWSTTATDAARRGTPVADDTDGPSVFDAVQEQLGLKIEKRRGPVQMLVVDHVEKKPTEN